MISTGPYHYNARWYAPNLGRFTTEAPIRDGLNWYAYANNNPLRFVDPTGLMGAAAALAAAESGTMIEDSDSSSGWTLPEEEKDGTNAGTSANTSSSDSNTNNNSGVQDDIDDNSLYYIDYNNLILYEEPVYFDGVLIGFGAEALERKQALEDFYGRIYGNTADALSNISLAVLGAGGVSAVVYPPATPVFFAFSAGLDLLSGSLYAGLSLASGLGGMKASKIGFNSLNVYTDMSTNLMVNNSSAYRTMASENTISLIVGGTSLSTLLLEE